MGKETVVRPKELSTSTQYFVLNLINNKHIQDYELLNLDMLSNAVAALKQFNAVYYEASYFTSQNNNISMENHYFNPYEAISIMP